MIDRSLGCGLGFISEECISQKTIYIYEKNEKKVFKQPFVEFIEQSKVWNGPAVTNQTSTVWGNAYKLWASSIVVSMLLIGSPAFETERNPLTGYYFVSIKFSAASKLRKNINLLEVFCYPIVYKRKNECFKECLFYPSDINFISQKFPLNKVQHTLTNLDDYINRHIKFSSRNLKYKKYSLFPLFLCVPPWELIHPAFPQLQDNIHFLEGQLSIGSEVVTCPI